MLPVWQEERVVQEEWAVREEGGALAERALESSQIGGAEVEVEVVRTSVRLVRLDPRVMELETLA